MKDASIPYITKKYETVYVNKDSSICFVFVFIFSFFFSYMFQKLLPGHGCVLHDIESLAGPSLLHPRPPYAGQGLVHER